MHTQHTSSIVCKKLICIYSTLLFFFEEGNSEPLTGRVKVHANWEVTFFMCFQNRDWHETPHCGWPKVGNMDLLFQCTNGTRKDSFHCLQCSKLLSVYNAWACMVAGNTLGISLLKTMNPSCGSILLHSQRAKIAGYSKMAWTLDFKQSIWWRYDCASRSRKSLPVTINGWFYWC